MTTSESTAPAKPRPKKLTRPVGLVVDAAGRMPHNFADKLVVQVSPHGIVLVREQRHKDVVELDLVDWYVRQRMADAKAAARSGR